jgi:hypothetical protein
MTPDPARREPNAPTASSSDREMLDFVYRELVGIHAAIDDTTHDDQAIVPWAKRELMGVIRELGAHRKAHRVAPQDAAH